MAGGRDLTAVEGDPAARAAGERWRNRTVLGVGVTSALGDLAYETGSVLLPGFLSTLGASAAALGAIEGLADATASFVKLGAGYLSDRLGHRKPLVLLGYALTPLGQALFALAGGVGLVLVGRVIGWFGRGVRGPLRDALLAEAVTPATRGRAFGFHRAADTVGAVVGPLVGVALLAFLQRRFGAAAALPYRWVFWLTLIPGFLAVLSFAWLVRETRRPAGPALRFWRTLRTFPARYRRFLAGVGLFGLGDFAPTLLILAATTRLTPAHGLARAAELAGLLYVGRNVVYSAASFPVGALADRVGPRRLLVGGYLLGALVAAGVLVAFGRGLASLGYWAALFGTAGVVVAIQDALEATVTAGLIPAGVRGTAFGVLGSVNGVGDLVSSVAVGGLWTVVSPVAGFGYAAVAMGAGALLLARYGRGRDD
ncbi:MAG TPA: MFS transporter [Thermomicrobiales bacterium]|nr:MFS transporter [Thermomicrobiales bacterium]